MTEKFIRECVASPIGSVLPVPDCLLPQDDDEADDPDRIIKSNYWSLINKISDWDYLDRMLKEFSDPTCMKDYYGLPFSELLVLQFSQESKWVVRHLAL